MAHYFFIVAYVWCFIYIFLKSRSFDLFSLLVLSLLFYYSSALFTHISIFGVVEDVPIDDRTYYALTFIFIASLFFTYVSDRSRLVKRISSEKKNTYVITTLLTIVSALVFMIGVYQLGGVSVFFAGSKSDLGQLNAVFYGLSIWLMLSTLAVSSYYKYHKYILICSIIAIFTLAVGSRATIVICIFVFSLLYFNLQKIRLAKYYKAFCILLCLVLFMVIYKFIYKSVRSGDFSSILNILLTLDFDSLIGVFMSESSSVVYNLNTVFVNELALPDHVLYHRLFSIIPFLGDYYKNLIGLDIPRFSYFLINDVYELHFGLASSIFGEVIAISGIVGFVIFVSLWLCLVSYFNLELNKGLSLYQVIFIPALVYSVFYIHRVDLTFFIGYFKYAIFIAIVTHIIQSLIFILPVKSSHE